MFSYVSMSCVSFAMASLAIGYVDGCTMRLSIKVLESDMTYCEKPSGRNF
jgi:hypothetical protein